MEGRTARSGSGAALRSARALSLTHLVILALTAATFLAIYIDVLTGVLANRAHIAADFIVFWTAARVPEPYDFEGITAAQRWYMGTDALRPFAYPPSFLPWLQGFAALPLLPAYLLWTTLTAALFLAAWWRHVGRLPLLVSVAAPTFLFAALPGQAVFLIGALLVSGLALAERRPVLAGLLLGLAATIKPQAMLLVPLALMAGGHWRALAWSILAGGGVGVASLLLQGPAIWIDWLRAMPEFLAAVREGGMIRYGITPASTIETAGIVWPWSALILLLSATLAVAALWIVASRRADLAHRIVVLNAATLLVLPYGMPYELALAAPAAAAMLLDRKLHPVIAIAAFLALTGAGGALAPAALCCALLWSVLRSGATDKPQSPPALDRACTTASSSP